MYVPFLVGVLAEDGLVEMRRDVDGFPVVVGDGLLSGDESRDDIERVGAFRPGPDQFLEVGPDGSVEVMGLRSGVDVDEGFVIDVVIKPVG